MATLTRSPGKSLILFILIRPDKWHKISWPLSKLTIKVAPGFSSSTSPTASIKSLALMMEFWLLFPSGILIFRGGLLLSVIQEIHPHPLTDVAVPVSWGASLNAILGVGVNKKT